MFHKITYLVFISLFLSACQTSINTSNAPTIKPFKSDGCSLFPDGWLGEPELWYHCCEAHDLTYWQGGTKNARLASDLELKHCVFDATQSQFMAESIYHGVRFGGSPVFPNWYHWGYGWSWGRGYFKLSPQELKQVADLQAQYHAQKAIKLP